jgi:hypothetical protein
MIPQHRKLAISRVYSFLAQDLLRDHPSAQKASNFKGLQLFSSRLAAGSSLNYAESHREIDQIYSISK